MEKNKEENEKTEKRVRKNLLRKSEEAKGIKIEGYDFDKGVNYEEIIKSYASTGYQASNLSKSIEIINKMISEKAFIFLGYTSNMVSSGLRDVFRYIV
ncbi:MAG: deoxyhypusine synthase family protein, partial [Nanoarchaeota archaeon]